jgi:hypothetical protein
LATSPTQLTLKKLREEGYLCQVVEHYNIFAKIRQDLFGFIDVIGVREGETIAVQATSYSNMSARINKIAEHDNVSMVRKAGWKIQVFGWHKKDNRWTVRIVDVS